MGFASGGARGTMLRSTAADAWPGRGGRVVFAVRHPAHGGPWRPGPGPRTAGAEPSGSSSAERGSPAKPRVRVHLVRRRCAGWAIRARAMTGGGRAREWAVLDEGRGPAPRPSPRGRTRPHVPAMGKNWTSPSARGPPPRAVKGHGGWSTGVMLKRPTALDSSGFIEPTSRAARNLKLTCFRSTSTGKQAKPGAWPADGGGRRDGTGGRGEGANK